MNSESRTAPTTDSGADRAAQARFFIGGREPQLQWRVTAGNGRVLGVSVTTFATMDEVRASIRQIRDSSADLVANYSHPRSGVGWRWVAGHPEGGRVAQCARNYERRATCVTGWERFAAALGGLLIECC